MQFGGKWAQNSLIDIDLYIYSLSSCIKLNPEWPTLHLSSDRHKNVFFKLLCMFNIKQRKRIRTFPVCCRLMALISGFITYIKTILKMLPRKNFF